MQHDPHQSSGLGYSQGVSGIRGGTSIKILHIEIFVECDIDVMELLLLTSKARINTWRKAANVK